MIKIVDTNFNSFIVTNLRLCVSNKLLLLVKVPTPFKSSLIDRMSFIISKNNCWCILKCLRVWRIRDLTLVSNKTIRERERKREREKERQRDRQSKQPSPAKKSRMAAPFSLHICRYKIKMIMSNESLLF